MDEIYWTMLTKTERTMHNFYEKNLVLPKNHILFQEWCWRKMAGRIARIFHALLHSQTYHMDSYGLWLRGQPDSQLPLTMPTATTKNSFYWNWEGIQKICSNLFSRHIFILKLIQKMWSLTKAITTYTCLSKWQNFPLHFCWLRPFSIGWQQLQ